MTLTKGYNYYDRDNDLIEIDTVDLDEDFDVNFGALAFLQTPAQGTYVMPEVAASLALNILGHDTPEDDREDGLVLTSSADREAQLLSAIASLGAVIRFDLREKRLASAEERRQRAAASLASSVHSIAGRSAAEPLKQFTNDDIGKLREALGRYDAALAN